MKAQKQLRLRSLHTYMKWCLECVCLIILHAKTSSGLTSVAIISRLHLQLKRPVETRTTGNTLPVEVPPDGGNYIPASKNCVQMLH